MKYYLSTILLVVLSLDSGAQSRVSRAIAFYNQAKQAYQQSDHLDYLRLMITSDSLLPYSRSVKYNLAAAYAVNDLFEKSFETIEELIQIDTQITFDNDTVFGNIRAIEGYRQLLQSKKEQNAPVINSEVAFELVETDLHPESIAYSRRVGVFYISSLRKRKVVIYNPRQLEVKDWISFAEIPELYGVMGMKISADDGYLWLCSSPLPEMEGYDESQSYVPSVFKVNLKDRSDIKRFELPEGSIPGDLELGPKGECYVSDSSSPRIFRIAKNKTEVFFDGGQQLVNLQGLTLVDDHLFVADYLCGVHKLSIRKKQLEKIDIDDPFNLAGVDGLYYYDNSLIAIQNGVYPFRVARYYLDENKNVKNFQYLDKAADFLDEPTLGTMVDDTFYYVANSPWSYYEDGELALDVINKPQIRKVKIAP